jgi:hypothetical protein
MKGKVMKITVGQLQVEISGASVSIKGKVGEHDCELTFNSEKDGYDIQFFADKALWANLFIPGAKHDTTKP